FPNKAPLNVANFLHYVNSGRYDNTVINRAQGEGDNSFVVQMGTFSSPTLGLPNSRNDFVSIPKFAPVQGEPSESTGLSNLRGTVGLALTSGAGGNGINPNSGTSSFYVNGMDNSFLDPDFTVFGMVTDMTTIDAIFNSNKIDPSHPVYQSLNLAVDSI